MSAEPSESISSGTQISEPLSTSYSRAVDFDDDVLAVGLLVKFNLEVEFGIGHETCLIDRIDLRGRDRCGSECTENADAASAADAVLNMNFCMVMWCSCEGENGRVRVRLPINGQMADGKGEDSFGRCGAV